MAEFGMAARPNTGNPTPAYARLHEKTLAQHRIRALPAVNGTSVQTGREPLTLSVYTSLAPVEALWTAFQEHAYSTFYQSFLWCRAWCETVGKSKDIEIRIVTATDQYAGIAFILPLQIRRRSGVRVLEWLGAPHTTYGQSLLAPFFIPRSCEWFSNNWAQIVTLAGPVDAVHLVNMPDTFEENLHPLQQLFNMRGPNRCYRMALGPDYDTLLAQKRSKETRRYYRKKERGLAARGNLSFSSPASKAETHATLRTMFEQQEKRLGERGVHGIFNALERNFIHRMVDIQDEAHPVLVPYFLSFQGGVLAVLLGGIHGNTFWAMISSLAETDLRKYSPGDLALRRTIEASCNRGLHSFDFAAGDTEYKLHWADDVTPLYVLLAATNLRGLPWACLMAAGTAVKRLIKQSPAIRNAAMSLRKALLGAPVRRGPPQD
jgi:CelD/BcsL family acetyltransferase involved in cellulose biosynthesis